jgi:hypothetical protein
MQGSTETSPLAGVLALQGAFEEHQHCLEAPFTVSPLQNWLGYHGTSQLADAVLRGEIPPDVLAQCTEGAQAIIEALQQKIAPPNSIDTRITSDDMKSGMSVWRESTSTSPSGQHLGYYKSMTAFELAPGKRPLLWSDSQHG